MILQNSDIPAVICLNKCDLKTEEVTDEGESKDLYESFLRNEAKVHINIRTTKHFASI